jgi:hypothetical protein
MKLVRQVVLVVIVDKRPGMWIKDGSRDAQSCCQMFVSHTIILGLLLSLRGSKFPHKRMCTWMQILEALSSKAL